MEPGLKISLINLQTKQLTFVQIMSSVKKEGKEGKVTGSIPPANKKLTINIFRSKKRKITLKSPLAAPASVPQTHNRTTNHSLTQTVPKQNTNK